MLRPAMQALRCFMLNDNRGVDKIGDKGVWALLEAWKAGHGRRITHLDLSGVVLHNHDISDVPWTAVFDAILKKEFRLDKVRVA